MFFCEETTLSCKKTLLTGEFLSTNGVLYAIMKNDILHSEAELGLLLQMRYQL